MASEVVEGNEAEGLPMVLHPQDGSAKHQEELLARDDKAQMRKIPFPDNTTKTVSRPPLHGVPITPVNVKHDRTEREAGIASGRMLLATRRWTSTSAQQSVTPSSTASSSPRPRSNANTRAISLPSRPDSAAALVKAGNAALEQHTVTGGIQHLKAAVFLARSSIDRAHQISPLFRESTRLLGTALHALGLGYFGQFEKYGADSELNLAIDAFREASTIEGNADEERAKSIDILGFSLKYRYERCGRLADLAESIRLHELALALCPPKSHVIAQITYHFGIALWQRFMYSKDHQDLNRAVSLFQQALELFSPTDPQRAAPMETLATALCVRFADYRKPEDLEQAETYYRASLALRPAGYANRHQSLHTLANMLYFRYAQLGHDRDLFEAIELAREALVLRPEGHHRRSGTLALLSDCLANRFELAGEAHDLDEAVHLQRLALQSIPAEHPLRSACLGTLSRLLYRRHELDGSIDDVENAVRLAREALALQPVYHEHHVTTLFHLANALTIKYRFSGASNDLEEALQLVEAARREKTSNIIELVFIGNILEICGASLDETMSVYQETLSALPPTHHQRYSAQICLARNLRKRFELYGDVSDINKAMDLNKQALVE